MCSHHFFARDASYIFTTYLVALHQAQFIYASTTRLHTAATRRDATKRITVCPTDFKQNWENLKRYHCKVCFVFFCWNGCLPEGRMWVSHLGFCLMSENRTNVPNPLSQVNLNTVATGNQTRQMVDTKQWIQADWNSVCLRRNLVVHTVPGRTPSIVQTLCKPFWAFGWFPIHNLSLNSTVQVTWT